MQDHDTHYKALFSHKEMVRDLLQGFAQGEWLKQADLNSLEQVNNDFVSEHYKPMQRHEDMIWRLKIGEHWVYLYMMLEFPSQPDRWMALRMLSYAALLWERLVKLNELAPNNLLPPILPIVLYNGEKPWDAPLELYQLYFPAPQELQQYQPRMRYWLLEERMLIEQAECIGVRNLAAAIFRLEFSSEPSDVRNVLLELNSWMQKGSSASLRRSMLRFAWKWFNRHAPGYDFDDLGHPDGDLTMLAERFEQWKTNIHQSGLHEGLQKGLQKGQAHSLCLLMEARFGSLSLEHRQRIEQADDQTLNIWMIRVLNAQTAEEVLL